MSETIPFLNLATLVAVGKIQTNNPRVYISGPISGYADLNAPAFKHGEECLKSYGLVPVNPLNITDTEALRKGGITPQEEWRICMKADLREMYSCGGIVLLKDWQNSMGATWEYLNAKVLGIPAFNLSNMEFQTHTIAELMELFHNVTKKITEADQDIAKELYRKIL